MKFVIYEEREWEQSESIFYIPRSKRHLLSQKYQSAIVKDLSDFDIILDNENNKLLQEVIEESVKLDSIMRSESFALPILLLRTEALSSSQIENYNSSNKNIALAQLSGSSKSQAKIISSNLNAIIHALNSKDNIDLDLIKSIHYELLKDSEKGNPGKIRHLPNWIGESSISPHEADYVPPHPNHLTKNLEDFTLFINRNDIHPFVKSAFSHAYFENIHPFEDGNGRVGRVLIQIVLKQTGFLSHFNIPLSTELVKDSLGYTEALTEFREGNYGRIVKLFCQKALNIIPKVYRLINDISIVKEKWNNNIVARKDAYVWTMIDEIISQPVINVSYFKSKYNWNDQAIRNNIDILLKIGVLKKSNDYKRNVFYECQEILTILDKF